MDVPWEFRRGECFRRAEVMGKRSEKAQWKKQALTEVFRKDVQDFLGTDYKEVHLRGAVENGAKGGPRPQ